MNFEALFDSFKHIKVAVIGDVMLDSYLFGNVERISPEAPVPIVAIKQKEHRIGGAGNVALNIVALGAETYIFSVTGKDEDGDTLQKLYTEQGIRTNYLIQSEGRTTTNKTRIMSHNQQMMRLDKEITHDISEDEAQLLLAQVKACIQNHKPDIVIFEDYNKGVLSKYVIDSVIQLCKQHAILTAVDPKKKHFFDYKQVDIFKPNLKEVKEGLNISIDVINQTNLLAVHALLQEKLQHKASFITLSEKGVFYAIEESSALIATHIRNIADVSGAGDTVIAVASLVFAATKDMHLAAEMANIAGGLVCEEVGTAAINREKFLLECQRLLHV
ncbi:MAG: bifunctional heptose 7-phosphate kinase/heptose 1-phosphate adenyltransferase [Chitinophagaceae bacterium]